MVEESFTRRLAAILVADVVGFSRLMESDEAGTLATLKGRRTLILQPTVRARGGRIVKFMGDGVLVEFASAVNAVTAAIELQRKMSEANGDLPDHSRIVLRVGINLGDVIGEGADIYGEGVNIAARLETLAEPGGIYISGKVHDEVRGKVDAAFEDAGERQLKNIATPVRVYRVGTSAAPMAPQTISPVSNKPSIAILPLDNLSGDPDQKYLSDGITGCCSWGDEPLITATVDEIGSAAIAPESLNGFSSDQIAARAVWNKENTGFDWRPPIRDESAALNWLRVEDAFGGDGAFIPADFAFIGRKGAGEEGAVAIGDSSGCAAGPSADAAKLAAILELVERDATGRWWYGRRQRRTIDPSLSRASTRLLTGCGIASVEPGSSTSPRTSMSQ